MATVLRKLELYIDAEVAQRGFAAGLTLPMLEQFLTFAIQQAVTDQAARHADNGDAA